MIRSYFHKSSCWSTGEILNKHTDSKEKDKYTLEPKSLNTLVYQNAPGVTSNLYNCKVLVVEKKRK